MFRALRVGAPAALLACAIGVAAPAHAATLSSPSADFVAKLLSSVDGFRIKGNQKIPNDARPVRLPRFVGTAAPAQPIAAGAIPQNPHMAATQWQNLSNDAGRSNAYAIPGPLGENTDVRSRLTMECTSTTFVRPGVMVGVCYGISGASLQIIDPITLNRGAMLVPPPRDPWKTRPDDFRPELIGGGAYYVDDQGRIVLPTALNQLWVIEVTKDATPQFKVVRKYDLRAAKVGSTDLVQYAQPDWGGRIWFVTRRGATGYVDPATGAVRVLKLGELVDNAISTAPDGAVYLNTVNALYRLSTAADGAPKVDWRVAYPNDGVRRAPLSYPGSGTTPTVLEVDGTRLVAMTDNQDPLTVHVYRADSGGEVCSVNAFRSAGASTETSMIGVGSSLVVTNQRGYNGPGQTGPGLTDILLGRLSHPGMTRIDVDPGATGCHIVWQADVRVPSGVPKLSLATGLIYAVERQVGEAVQDVFYLQAIDFRTGQVRWKQQYGSGLTANNNYSAITLGPDGSAYTGGMLGIYRIADTKAAG